MKNFTAEGFTFQSATYLALFLKAM